MAADLAVINAEPDNTVGDVTAKADLYEELQHSPTYERAKLAADAWCSAFVAEKRSDLPAITDRTIREIAEGRQIQRDTRHLITQLAEQYQFLHPHITFPDIHQTGGFDLVVGNPPWGRIKLQEKQWFASRDPAIANAPNQAARRRLIDQLRDNDPDLYEQFHTSRNQAERTSILIQNSGRYPLSARGDINTYQIFADLMRTTTSPEGRTGMIVPTGIATDDQTKHFFADLIQTKSIVSLYDFENRKGIFPSVHRSYKFCLLTLTGKQKPSERADFVTFALDVADIDNPDKRYTLTPSDLMLFNPNTRTMPIFRNRRDADITTGIYRQTPILIKEGDPDTNPWEVTLSTMYHMSNDSGLFRTRPQLEDDSWMLRGNHFHRGDDLYVPLYVLVMVHQYDHRWATFENGKFRDITEAEKQDPTFLAQPRYWVPAAETDKRIGDDREWLLGWRRVARTTDIRTLIMSPHPRAGVGDSFFELVLPRQELLGVVPVTVAMNSFACDFVARQKVGGTNLSFFYMRQFAVLSPEQVRKYQAFLEPRVLELCYTAWDMAPFAAEFGWDGPPFRWDTERRALIRAEIDALMFRLYGIGSGDIDYILDHTFEGVRKNDTKRWGEYQTKRLILERYDAMDRADRDGQTYQTVLDPPPAHPSAAHDWSTRPGWYPLTGGEAAG